MLTHGLFVKTIDTNGDKKNQHEQGAYVKSEWTAICFFSSVGHCISARPTKGKAVAVGHDAKAAHARFLVYQILEVCLTFEAIRRSRTMPLCAVLVIGRSIWVS
jgi:hypothetical protein